MEDRWICVCWKWMTGGWSIYPYVSCFQNTHIYLSIIYIRTKFHLIVFFSRLTNGCLFFSGFNLETWDFSWRFSLKIFSEDFSWGFFLKIFPEDFPEDFPKDFAEDFSLTALVNRHFMYFFNVVFMWNKCSDNIYYLFLVSWGKINLFKMLWDYFYLFILFDSKLRKIWINYFQH